MSEAPVDEGVSVPVRSARARVQSEHLAVLGAIDYCADAVCASWESDRTRDRRAVVEPLRTELDGMGVLERLPVVLSDAVEATGYDLSATPVPAPPYVVVTSRGPILRATIEPGRLVIRFDAFEVSRDPNPCYERRSGVRLDVRLK